MAGLGVESLGCERLHAVSSGHRLVFTGYKRMPVCVADAAGTAHSLRKALASVIRRLAYKCIHRAFRTRCARARTAGFYGAIIRRSIISIPALSRTFQPTSQAKFGLVQTGCSLSPFRPANSITPGVQNTFLCQRPG